MYPTRSAAPRHREATPALRIALLGTPAHGPAGFDTALEEIGKRLVDRGHDVTLVGHVESPEQLGAHVVVPAGGRSLASTASLIVARRPQVAVLLDAASAPLLPALRSGGAAIALRATGLTGPRPQRRAGIRSSRAADALAVRQADALIADSAEVAQAIRSAYGAEAEVLPSGARILRNTPADALTPLGLQPGGFHLVAAELAAEGLLDAVLDGYRRSSARLPLVVLGGDTQPGRSGETGGIRLLGPVRDQRLLDQLHAHALSSVHGTSTRGTSPAILAAMGAATAVVAMDTDLNRAIAGTAGSYFRSTDTLGATFSEVERYAFRFRDLGALMQERAKLRHDWNVVAERIDAVAARLARTSTVERPAAARAARVARSSAQRVGATHG
ncbi:MAG: hypothetical protein QOE37_1364 [Microbacteriaceae bacterium]|nr:hypothetical protein [Microbacteriaceae bacterium]